MDDTKEDIVDRAEAIITGHDRTSHLGEMIRDLVAEVKRLRASTIRAQVSEFHRAFGQAIGDKPAVPDDEVVRLRAKLVMEESFEMLDAMYGNLDSFDRIQAAKQTVNKIIEELTPSVDLVEVADALADIDYVVEGSRLAFGIDGLPIAVEVHRSNLSKLGADGKPVKRADGKVVKGPNYSPPDIASVLRSQGWQP